MVNSVSTKLVPSLNHDLVHLSVSVVIDKIGLVLVSLHADKDWVYTKETMSTVFKCVVMP